MLAPEEDPEAHHRKERAADVQSVLLVLKP